MGLLEKPSSAFGKCDLPGCAVLNPSYCYLSPSHFSKCLLLLLGEYYEKEILSSLVYLTQIFPGNVKRKKTHKNLAPLKTA
jgi:hypothetical protein